MTWKPDIVIYHHPCDDGFGAAWAAWTRWGDDVQYVPAAYGQPAPDVTGKHVLIGDFSYKRDVLEQMARQAASIVILDHHTSAEADLQAFRAPTGMIEENVESILADLAALDLSPVLAQFDMERSGARMMWDFCRGEEGLPVPDLIRMIEDRDLWRFEIPETKAFTMWLRSIPYEFEEWAHVSSDLQLRGQRQLIMAEAHAMKRFYDQKISEMAQLVFWSEIGGHNVPTVNCPNIFASDVCHELLRMFPAAPFAASFHIREDKKGFSLRSEHHRLDVSKIAETFGGGGHRNAAGFGVAA